jgi:hypothetical protein
MGKSTLPPMTQLKKAQAMKPIHYTITRSYGKIHIATDDTIKKGPDHETYSLHNHSLSYGALAPAPRLTTHARTRARAHTQTHTHTHTQTQVDLSLYSHNFNPPTIMLAYPTNHALSSCSQTHSVFLSLRSLSRTQHTAWLHPHACTQHTARHTARCSTPQHTHTRTRTSTHTHTHT